MNSSNEKERAWELMEDAVVRDRQYDEELQLSRLVQSYLSRRGMADTLTAFNADLDDIEGKMKSSLPLSSSRTVSSALVDDARKRKQAQLLCLEGKLAAAAAMLPQASVLAVKLLCLAALEKTESHEALQFLLQEVGPLVPRSVNPAVSHALYVRTVTAIMTMDRPRESCLSPAQRKGLALEVNEALLHDNEPSSLHVLVSWLDYQQTSSHHI